MGVTNIRSGHMLLEQAGKNLDQVAFIPENVMRSIYLEARSISKEELETYSNFLLILRSDRDRWLDFRGWPLEIPPRNPILPQAIVAPKVVLSPGLSRNWIQRGRKSEEQQVQEPEDLAFIAIVQGLAGASVIKVVVKYSAEAIGNAMFHELMNGYSIVFSGVLLKSEEKRRLSCNVRWQKVETYDQLLQMKKSNEGLVSPTNDSSFNPAYKIGIVC
jgi:hypothetical protein